MRMRESPKLGSRAPRLTAVSWLGLGIALAFAGGCTKSPPFPEEDAALKTLIDEYQLKRYKKDKEGQMIDVTLEGPRFDDKALALAGTFLQLRGMSIARSKVTDAGLEDLPVLKNLQQLNINAPGVTNRGVLAVSAKMPSLKHVWYVESDKVNAAAIEGLKKTHPGVQVHDENKPN
jgi:hypothetical protein